MHSFVKEPTAARSNMRITRPATRLPHHDRRVRSLLRHRDPAHDATGAQHAPPIVDDVLSSPGQPLPTAIASRFGSRLGQDFSRVRVHADSRAAASARAVGAVAYTVGRHVVFAEKPKPAGAEGQALWAHELTHVAQQRSAEPSLGAISFGATNSALERQADAVANTIGNASEARVRGASRRGGAIPSPAGGSLLQRATKAPDCGKAEVASLEKPHRFKFRVKNDVFFTDQLFRPHEDTEDLNVVIKASQVGSGHGVNLKLTVVLMECDWFFDNEIGAFQVPVDNDWHHFHFTDLDADENHYLKIFRETDVRIRTIDGDGQVY